MIDGEIEDFSSRVPGWQPPGLGQEAIWSQKKEGAQVLRSTLFDIGAAHTIAKPQLSLHPDAMVLIRVLQELAPSKRDTDNGITTTAAPAYS